jgi:multidrug efflux system outer membrane protein
MPTFRGGNCFRDPTLQELIRTVLKQNYDLQLVTERVNAARAQLSVARSSLFPGSGNADFSGAKEDVVQSRYNFLTLTAGAAFRTGFLQSRTPSQRSSACPAARQRGRASNRRPDPRRRCSSDYFALLQLDLQLAITRETVKTQTDSVELTQLRVEHGAATKLDVLQD